MPRSESKSPKRRSHHSSSSRRRSKSPRESSTRDGSRDRSRNRKHSYRDDKYRDGDRKERRDRHEERKDNVLRDTEVETREIGPQIPQEYLSSIPRAATPPVEQAKPVLGPRLPPGCAQQDGSSSPEIGPALPSSRALNYDKHLPDLLEDDLDSKIAEIESRARGKPMQPEVESAKRGEWMTVPPEANRLGFDTKSRQFSRSKGGRDSSGWTNLPGQKTAHSNDEISGPSARDLQQRQMTREYNERHRPMTLMEQHTAKVSAGEFDDPNKRKFDREKDMGRRVDSNKAKKLIAQAGDLNNRFSAPKYL
jgi:hypothetical protein